MVWVSRIMAVTVEMVAPGLAGEWLDGRLGTKFLVLVGFGLGLTLGIWHLLVMTRTAKPPDARDERKRKDTTL